MRLPDPPPLADAAPAASGSGGAAPLAEAEAPPGPPEAAEDAVNGFLYLGGAAGGGANAFVGRLQAENAALRARLAVAEGALRRLRAAAPGEASAAAPPPPPPAGGAGLGEGGGDGAAAEQPGTDRTA